MDSVDLINALVERVEAQGPPPMYFRRWVQGASLTRMLYNGEVRWRAWLVVTTPNGDTKEIGAYGDTGHEALQRCSIEIDRHLTRTVRKAG